MTDLTPLDTTWLLFSAFLVMTMQIGFCMLEAGLVRQKNSINVAFKNLMDFVIAALVYWGIGYGVMFGASANGWFGTDGFLVASRDTNAAFLLFQLVFCGTAATIIGGALAERTRFLGYAAITVLTAGLIYPVVGHWTWGGSLGADGAATGWLGRIGFVDFAGGTVVHSTGGWMALAGALVVGARLGRFPARAPDRGAPLDAAGPDETAIGAQVALRPIGGSNYVLATLGVLMLWFGWFGFNGGSALGYDEAIGPILINTVLAAAAGGLVLVLLAFVRDAKPDIAACLNGTLAGLVSVTAGAHLYETTDAVLVGISGAVVASLATGALARARVDDVIGAFPVHAAAGATGTLLVALLGDPAGFAGGRGPLEQLGVQAIGVGAVALWAFGVGYAFLFVLNAILPLRVSEADERRGLNVAEHDASSDLVALLEDMGTQRATGDFAVPLAVEPHTEIGQIAAQYNRVTERVRAEIAEREDALARLRSASQFQFIFENANEGIVRFGLDGRIEQANPAAARILGHASVADLVARGGAFLGALDWSDGAAYRRTVDRLTSKGLVQDVELDFRRRVDGRDGHVKVSVRRIDAREGDPAVGADGAAPEATYLASLADVSERRANERLSLEVDAAQAASRAKSEFLANMSHEIRTPLNGVTGMLELLSRTALDARQERYVRIAGSSAKSLLSVLNDILDVSKIEAGKLDLDPVEFDLPELLGDVVDMFATQAAGKRLELVARLDPALPTRVVGDPERLRQILVNLLGNAIKFTDSGTVSLAARPLEPTADGPSPIELAVQDTGIGIAAEDSARLFEPFEQGDGSTTRRFGGTGLGLSISRRLANLMGGAIEVDSEPGHGTTFRATLPFEPARAVHAHARPGIGTEHAGLRVLAVDDHVVNLELLKELLEPQGLVVGRVTNAEAALEELDRAAEERAPYALVLLDCHMPGTDGYALARRVRERPEHDEVALIMLTSIDQSLPAAERERLGIAGHVVKPLRPSRLFDALGAVLGDAPEAARATGATRSDGADAPGAPGAPDTSAPVGAGAVARADDEIPLEDLMADALGGRVAGPSERAAVAALEGRHALVVEDNAVNQLVTEELVELLGMRVSTVDDGRAALDRLAEERFDVVLMDIQMPRMDGFEATRAWRAREAELGLEPVPIVAVTANAVVGDRERCLEAGMDGYVTKPIEPEALAEVLARALSGSFGPPGPPDR